MSKYAVKNYSHVVPKRGYCNFIRYDSSGISGSLSTPWGVVNVSGFNNSTDTSRHHTLFNFICNGRTYGRIISGKCYTPRGARTKAFRFAQEIHSKQLGENKDA